MPPPGASSRRHRKDAVATRRTGSAPSRTRGWSADGTPTATVSAIGRSCGAWICCRARQERTECRQAVFIQLRAASNKLSSCPATGGSRGGGGGDGRRKGGVTPRTCPSKAAAKAPRRKDAAGARNGRHGRLSKDGALGRLLHHATHLPCAHRSTLTFCAGSAQRVVCTVPGSEAYSSRREREVYMLVGLALLSMASEGANSLHECMTKIFWYGKLAVGMCLLH